MVHIQHKLRRLCFFTNGPAPHLDRELLPGDLGLLLVTVLHSSTREWIQVHIGLHRTKQLLSLQMHQQPLQAKNAHLISLDGGVLLRQDQLNVAG